MVLLCACLCVFFFFKQKTAYEMRISDWSSDVCSSDLAMNVTSAPAPAGVDEAAVAGLEMVPSRLVRPPRAKASPVPLECRYLQTVDLPSAVHGTRNAVVFGQVTGKIGRASCRERVWQYV